MDPLARPEVEPTNEGLPFTLCRKKETQKVLHEKYRNPNQPYFIRVSAEPSGSGARGGYSRCRVGGFAATAGLRRTLSYETHSLK